MSTELADQLFARGALMGVHIGRWGALKKMNADDMLLKEVDRDVLYLGHKKLLPKKALEKFVELEGKARRTLADNSIEFHIASARYVTYSAMADVVSKLSALRTQWEAELDSLVTEYPEFKKQQLVLLERQAQTFVNEEKKKVATDDLQFKDKMDRLDEWLAAQKAKNEMAYPKDTDLRRRFSFNWRMFRISAMDGINELDEEEVLKAQEQLRKDLNDWVRLATASIHKTLGEAAQNARKTLDKNGKLTPRNLKPLFDAFESFVAVDFTGKSSFRETIDTIKKKFLHENPDGSFNLTQTSDNIVSSATEFDRLLKDVSELASEDIASKAGTESLVEFGRVID